MIRRVAARSHDSVLDSTLLQDVDPAVNGVTLADAAEVDAHSLVLEEHSVVRVIELHVAPVHCRQRRFDLLLRWADMVRVVIEVADAGVRDIERTFGDFGVVRRQLDEIEQLFVDLHGIIRRMLS